MMGMPSSKSGLHSLLSGPVIAVPFVPEPSGPSDLLPLSSGCPAKVWQPVRLDKQNPHRSEAQLSQETCTLAEDAFELQGLDRIAFAGQEQPVVVPACTAGAQSR